MSPATTADLINSVPQITTIKMEALPTPERTKETISVLGSEITILGGLGGMYFLDELRSGASGTMTGFAYPEILLSIWQSWLENDQDHAAKLYSDYLPILSFEGQPGIGLAIRKEILRRRGLIDCAILREPAMQLSESIASELTSLLKDLNLESQFDIIK